ncbi:MAG: DUF21 domain-containing protein [candidate division Zixibacteria bacterium]|nr:DUF21 domain-containing protein [candidate division Zixibacteria bacterium]
MMLYLELLLIFILMLLSGFFSASEIGVIAVRKSRIKQLIKSKDARSRQAKYVGKLHDDPDRFFAIVQIGMTVTATASSAVGGAIAVQIIKPLLVHINLGGSEAAAESIALTIVIVVISYLFLILAELYPKGLAIRFPERIALLAGSWTYYAMKFTLPLINFLTWSTNICLKLTGIEIKKDRQEEGITEEEVKHILTEGLRTGTFNKTERELITGVFEFADMVARQVMTPRTDIDGIALDTPSEVVIQMITASRFTRFPVYQDSMDNIVGVIHARDVIGILREKDLLIVADIMRKPFFIPDSKPLVELLRDFQQNQSHMAIVLDEFGGTAGLVTLEDLLEEIVGEIQDEYDKERTQWGRSRDGSLSVAADMSVEDFNDEFKTELPEGDADTVAGLMVNTLGRLPRGGESVEIDGHKFTVTEREGNRIRRLRVQKIEPSPGPPRDEGGEEDLKED